MVCLLYRYGDGLRICKDIQLQSTRKMSILLKLELEVIRVNHASVVTNIIYDIGVAVLR